KTPLYFFQAALRVLGIADVETQNYGGIGDLAGFLKAFRNHADFPTVQRIGIARDAEANCQSALQSVNSALGHAGLVQPSQPLLVQPGPPDVIVYLFPDCASAGML